MTRSRHHTLLTPRPPRRRFQAFLLTGLSIFLGVTLLLVMPAASGAVVASLATGLVAGSAKVVTAVGASDGKAVEFGVTLIPPAPSAAPSASPSESLGTSPAACTTSGATGAGSPSKTFPVGPPTSGDNSTQIQAAIASATSSGGGIVSLQAGTYTIAQTITLGTGVVLSGAGESTTTLMAASTANVDPMITTGGSSNITVQNLTVNQNGSSSASSQSLTYYMVEDRSGSNVIFQNIATRDPSTYSMVAVSASDFCFRGNNIEQDAAENGKFNQLDGIHILNSTNGDVRDNYVDNSFGGATDGDDGLVAHAIGGTTANITYAGNVVRGGQNGAGMGIWVASGGKITNITVTGNEFWGLSGPHPGDTNAFTGSSITGNNLHNDPGGMQIAGTGLTVTGNQSCASGAITITGSNDTVRNNGTYTSCSDSPTTTTPPPVIP